MYVHLSMSSVFNFSQHLCPLEISHSKSGKVRIVTGENSNRGGIYTAPTADLIVEGLYTEIIRWGVTSKYSRKEKYVRSKEKGYISILELI